MIYFAMFFLCGFPGGSLAKGQKSKSRLNIPMLEVEDKPVEGKQVVMEANQTLQLNCRGLWQTSWLLPPSVEPHYLHVEERRCGKQQQQHCSRLTLSPALSKHTGRFRCRSHSHGQTQASLYVYITDRQQPFVEEQIEVPDMVYLKEGKALVFPCRVTSPDIPVTLVKIPGQRLFPDEQNIVWNSKRGFVVLKPTYHHIGLFSCEVTVDGVLHSSKYLTYRPVNKILEVYLNTSESVQALRGDSLALNCTVTAAWNSRVSITWRYPGQAGETASVSRRMHQRSSSLLFYSVLSIPRLARSDHGLYVCSVTSGPSTRETKTALTVYDQPFIRLKHRHGEVLTVQSGQKAYRLSVKLRAFPTPQIVWLKDGLPASERCSRYQVEGSSLMIHDVSAEDAGVYTVVVAIYEHDLYKNLTLSLVVHMKPQIGETAVSQQDVVLVTKGRQKALYCTSHGVPLPQIHWLWHPCPQKGPTSTPLP